MKRILIAASLASAGISAGLFYYWQQATQLPDWYSADSSIENGSSSSNGQSSATSDHLNSLGETSKPSSVKQPKPVEAKIASQVQKSPNSKEVNVQLNKTELNHLFTSEVARKAQSSKFAPAVRGVNTTIQNGKVESGAVVNLGDIPPSQLASNERAVVSKLVSAFPELGKRSVYIGLEGKPTVINGQVKLDGNTLIKLGNLSFTPAELSQRLGIPEDQIRQQIQLQLQLGKVNVRDFELVGDRAVVRGTPN